MVRGSSPLLFYCFYLMIYSPLEQFQVYPLFFFKFCSFDVSFTNSSLILLIGIFSLLLCLRMILSSNQQIYFVPKHWQVLIESIYSFLLSMVVNNIGEEGQKFFPFIFSIFFFLIVCNLIGLVPYSFTVTSHLIVTFGLATMVFVGVNIICFRKHKMNIFTLFLPSGTSLGLAFILIPIELLSYIFRPLSLAVRLFINMMTGHTLLKIIGGFAWAMMASGGVLFVANFVPLLLLVILMLLEFSVGLIQAYVFTLLTCIYLNDAVNLH